MASFMYGPDWTLDSRVDRNKDKANPFAGTQYESLWENNPYKDLYREPTFWDDIGLSSKAKDANYHYQQLYDEYIAGIYEQQRQDEYNSPENQAKLQREAGLNPDLNGVSSFESGPMSPPMGGQPSAHNGQSPAYDAFGILTNVLGFATSAYQQIVGIKGLSLDNITKSIGNFNEFQNLARPHIVAEYARRFSSSDSNNWSDVAATAAIPFKGRSKQQYKEAFFNLLSSSEFDTSRQAYERLSADDYAMRHFTTGMVKLSIEQMKHGFMSQTSQSKYNYNYYNKKDPDLAASADNRENSNRGWLDKWRNEYYETLYKDFKNGSMLAGLILIGSSNLFNGSIVTAGSDLESGIRNVGSWLDNTIGTPTQILQKLF